MKSSVLLTWEIPDTYNPAQPFTVSYGLSEPYIIVTFLDIATQTIQLTRTIIHRTDPLRQWPERGGGWKANTEANHGSSARDAVLVPPDQPWQQRRRPAAPCVHHDCTRHPSHKTLPDQQDKLGRHGDRGAADSRDIRESEVSGEDPINGGFYILGIRYINCQVNTFEKK